MATIAQQAKLALVIPTFHTGVLVQGFQYSCQLIYLGRQQMLLQMPGSLSPTWEIWDPGFRLTQAWSLWTSGEWTSGWGLGSLLFHLFSK